MGRAIQQRFKRRRELTVLYSVPILLTLLGLFFIFEASSVSAFRTIGDSFYFLKLQAGWLVIGISAMLFFSFFDYHKLYYLSFPVLLSAIVLLLLVLIPGIGDNVQGARRWISVGSFGFQPTEYAKFAVILYLSSWFLYKERKRFFSFLMLLLFVMGLIIIQPDLGTAILIFSLFVIIYFISGEDIRYLLFLIPASIAGFLVLIQTSPYRMRRLLTFLNPEIDPQGISYHLRQILISLSAGGVLGRGFSGSRQKYQFLPEAHTDSIFAIMGEEVGFVGSTLFIAAYIVLLYSAYKVSLNAKDKYGRILAGSILSLIAMQVLINLGGMVNIIPLTGLPLPFISYGGSSLIVFYALMGILTNIAKK